MSGFPTNVVHLGELALAASINATDSTFWCDSPNGCPAGADLKRISAAQLAAFVRGGLAGAAPLVMSGGQLTLVTDSTLSVVNGRLSANFPSFPSIPWAPLISGQGTAFGSIALGANLSLAGTFPNQTLEVTISGGPGGGVTQLSQGNGITLTPNPITGSGTISLNATASQIAVSPAVQGGSNVQTALTGLASAIGAAGGGTITGVMAGTGLSGGGTTGSVTLNLANTAVTPGSYTFSSITVDAQGRITAASSGAPGGGGTGTVTSIAAGIGLAASPSPITGSGTLSLATSGVAAGTYQGITIDTYGRVTGASNQNYLTGITSAQVTGALGFTPVSSSGVTSINAGTGLGGGGATATVTLNLANTTVTAGSYTNASITVDAQGRLTAASTGSASGGVTSVGAGTGITVGGASTAPTVGLTVPVSIANGGTNATSMAQPAIGFTGGNNLVRSNGTSLSTSQYWGDWGDQALAGYMISNTAGPYIAMQRTRGTSSANRSAVQSGDTLGAISFWGYPTPATNASATCSIRGTATQTFTTSASGGSLTFLVTANGSTVPQTAVTINQDRSVTLTGPLTVAGTSTLTATRIRVTGDGSGMWWITGTNTSPERGSLGIHITNNQPDYVIFGVQAVSQKGISVEMQHNDLTSGITFVDTINTSIANTWRLYYRSNGNWGLSNPARGDWLDVWLSPQGLFGCSEFESGDGRPGQLTNGQFYGDMTVWKTPRAPQANFTITCDSRTKRDVGQYTTGLAAVRRLNCITFHYNGFAETPVDPDEVMRYGFDVEATARVMPEMVGKRRGKLVPASARGLEPEELSIRRRRAPDIEVETIDTSPLLFALVNSVKELADRLETVEGKVH